MDMSRCGFVIYSRISEIYINYLNDFGSTNIEKILNLVVVLIKKVKAGK